MNPAELRSLGESLARSLDQKGQPFFELKLQLGRLLSHLESEQRVTMRMEKQIEQHDRALYGDKDDPESHPGISNIVFAIHSRQKRTEKLILTVLAAVVGAFILQLLHLKP